MCVCVLEMNQLSVFRLIACDVIHSIVYAIRHDPYLSCEHTMHVISLDLSLAHRHRSLSVNGVYLYCNVSVPLTVSCVCVCVTGGLGGIGMGLGPGGQPINTNRLSGGGGGGGGGAGGGMGSMGPGGQKTHTRTHIASMNQVYYSMITLQRLHHNEDVQCLLYSCCSFISSILSLSISCPSPQPPAL